jgi:hypothetical protein
MAGNLVLVMKNITATLILFVLLAQAQTWGQNFGGAGYEWYYSGHNAAPPEYSGYIRFSHAGDTVIASRSAHLLLQQNYNYTGGLAATDRHIITQVSDTVFLYREDLSAFIVLYVFNRNVGDTITLDAPFSVPGVSAPSTYRVVVDSVSVENYNGDDLKKYYTQPLDDFYWPGVLMDQIGCTGWFFPSAVGSIPEGPGDIRCFSNPQLSINFNAYPCDYHLMVPTFDANDDLRIEIFPNPSSDKLWISTPQEIATVRIVDMSGKTVLVTNQSIINIHAFQPGPYVIQVTTKSGGVRIQKIIKM